MFCRHCGASAQPPDARHCSNCGGQLAGYSNRSASAPAGHRSLPAVLVVLIMVVVGGLVVALQTLGRDTAPSAPVAQSTPEPTPLAVTSEPTEPIQEPIESNPEPTELDDAELARVWGDSVFRAETDGCGTPGSGTAFVIDDRHLVTNQHVVSTDPTPVLVSRDGERIDGRVIGWSDSPDVAVIAVDEPLPQPLTWAPTADLREGQHLVGLGYPVPETDFSVTPSSIISFQMREGTRQAIRADGALDRGNSGGPALTTAGQVAGVVTEMESNAHGFQLVPLLFTTEALAATVNQIIAAPGTVEATCQSSVQALPEDWWDAFDDITPASDQPSEYGDDPELDALHDACDAGDLDACDDLFTKSPYGSAYEAFGSTCGDRDDPVYGMCSFWADFDSNNPIQETAPASPDPALDTLRDTCLGGDDEACDELYYSADYGSADEETGSTCGGRSSATYGGCATYSSGTSDTSSDGLRASCAGGDNAACNDLYWISPAGSSDEEYGSTCAGRSEPMYGSC